jgi:hypothetical protein
VVNIALSDAESEGVDVHNHRDDGLCYSGGTM